MTSHAREDSHEIEAAAEPVTDRVHDNSWSANLEKPEHAADRALVVSQAREAIAHTAPGNHVNLVTHGDHGHPESYLYEALAETYGADGAAGDDSVDGEDVPEVDWEYVDQCGCGGHVVRVHVS